MITVVDVTVLEASVTTAIGVVELVVGDDGGSEGDVRGGEGVGDVNGAEGVDVNVLVSVAVADAREI